MRCDALVYSLRHHWHLGCGIHCQLQSLPLHHLCLICALHYGTILDISSTLADQAFKYSCILFARETWEQSAVLECFNLSSHCRDEEVDPWVWPAHTLRCNSTQRWRQKTTSHILQRVYIPDTSPSFSMWLVCAFRRQWCTVCSAVGKDVYLFAAYHKDVAVCWKARASSCRNCFQVFRYYRSTSRKFIRPTVLVKSLQSSFNNVKNAFSAK